MHVILVLKCLLAADILPKPNPLGCVSSLIWELNNCSEFKSQQSQKVNAQLKATNIYLFFGPSVAGTCIQCILILSGDYNMLYMQKKEKESIHLGNTA